MRCVWEKGGFCWEAWASYSQGSAWWGLAQSREAEAEAGPAALPVCMALRIPSVCKAGLAAGWGLGGSSRVRSGWPLQAAFRGDLVTFVASTWPGMSTDLLLPGLTAFAELFQCVPQKGRFDLVLDGNQ